MGIGARTDGDTVGRIERLFATLKRFRDDLSPDDDENALFERVCRIAVELAEFRFAWIGVVDRTRGVVVPRAHAGQDPAYLEGLEIAIADAPNGRGPTGTAVREGRSVVCPDTMMDVSVAPWRERMTRFGFRSSGAFPIRRANATYAALNLYADVPRFIESIEKTMAEELAAELGLALDAIDREARYRSIVERAADGVLIFAGDRRVLDANPAFCRMFGYTREELLAMHVNDLIPPEKHLTYKEEITRFHAGEPGSTVSLERTGLTKDGRHIDLDIHSTVLAQGAAISVVRDVTERKRIETERAATERLVSLGRLAQSVGHEINNPLSFVTLRIEHARSLIAPLAPELRRELEETLASAADGAARIAHVVRALSAFGRGDIERIESIPVRSVVDAALSLVNNRLQHVAELEVSLADTPPVRANAFGLTQVVVNLLLNAVDAMEAVRRDRHQLTISSRMDGEHVLLEVADTGTGIAPADLPRLFDVGFTTKAVGKGTGVGLAISRSIIASIGGSLDARNRPEGGAVFRVVLPTARRAKETRAKPPPPKEHGRRRILVVDDEPLVAKTLALLLGSQPSAHEVTVCTSVDEAFDHCLRETFDWILCDLMMPNGGGMELYDRVGKERPALRDRIVFMTGGTFTDAATKFLQEVPNRRLIKPFPSEQLLAIVEGTPSA